jgi:hypothetical protein
MDSIKSAGDRCAMLSASQLPAHPEADHFGLNEARAKRSHRIAKLWITGNIQQLLRLDTRYTDQRGHHCSDPSSRHLFGHPHKI